MAHIFCENAIYHQRALKKTNKLIITLGPKLLRYKTIFFGDGGLRLLLISPVSCAVFRKDLYHFAECQKYYKNIIPTTGT
jgi:hypothetical protein